MKIFSTKWKRLFSFSIISVLLLMGFVYYITIFVLIEESLGLQSSAGSLNAFIFSTLASLCLLSFIVCVFTDPGHIPSSYAPDVELNGAHEQESNGEKLKQCDKCCTFKPPRAHHCRVCRRCILRMDHHCLWINNCVGYWNYKAYITLILYATAGSLYSTVVIISFMFRKDLNFSGNVSLKVLYISFAVMMAALSLTLGTLLGWHFYLIMHNMTTIEYYEGIRAAWLARKSGQSYRHPFDISAYTNIISVLGPNTLKWFCPTAVSHLRDGLNFPTSHHN